MAFRGEGLSNDNGKQREKYEEGDRRNWKDIVINGINNKKLQVSCNCILCYFYMIQTCIYFMKNSIYNYNNYLIYFVSCCRKS
jgi:hypothetical protein